MVLPPLPAPWLRRFGSLKLRLAVIGFVLVAASAALTTALVLREVGQRTEQVVNDLTRDQTRKLARTISTRLLGLQLALRSVGEQLPLDKVADEAAMRDFLDLHAVLCTMFNNTFVALPDGRVTDWRDNSGQHVFRRYIGDRPYFELSLRQGRPIVSEAVVGRFSGEPVIVLTMPVRNAGGRIVAVFGGSLRLSSRSLFADLIEADAEDLTTTVVMDAHGRVLAHPDRNWVMREAVDEPRLTDAVWAWRRQGQPVEPTGEASRAGAYIVGLAGVPDADWVVLRSAPANVLLGGLSRGRTQGLKLAAAVALAGGLLMLLATFVMLAPLRQLQRRAERLLDARMAADEGWPEASGELGQLSTVFQHVMRQRSASEAANRELLAKMQALMARAPVGIAFTRNRRFELVSHNFDRLFGYAPLHTLQGEPPRLIYASQEFYEALGERVIARFSAQQSFDEEIEFVRRDGSRFWGRLQGAPVLTGDAQAGTIWTVDDVTEARRQRLTLAWKSSHDTLTRLPNRHEFEQRLASALAATHGGPPASALFIDLDHFKRVNDSAGHAAGDRVLVDVARLLATTVRGTDTVARLGGDEFGVLLPGCDTQAAQQIAEKMRAAIEAYHLVWGEQRFRLGLSIGVVTLGSEFGDLNAVLGAADAACYAAKRSGRNRVCVHGQAPAESLPG